MFLPTLQNGNQGFDDVTQSPISKSLEQLALEVEVVCRSSSFIARPVELFSRRSRWGGAMYTFSTAVTTAVIIWLSFHLLSLISRTEPVNMSSISEIKEAVEQLSDRLVAKETEVLRGLLWCTPCSTGDHWVGQPLPMLLGNRSRRGV